MFFLNFQRYPTGTCKDMKIIKLRPDVNPTYTHTTVIQIQLTPEELSSIVTKAVREALSQSASKPDDTLFTRKETAKYFNVTLPTLNAWEKSGRIKGIRFGSRVYFRKNDLLNAA
jgi:excisionase family DNA binding protein